MRRMKKLSALLLIVGGTLALPVGSAFAHTTGGPTAPNGANYNNQTTVCHHNSPPNGAVTVINRGHGVIDNGSGGDSECFLD